MKLGRLTLVVALGFLTAIPQYVSARGIKRGVDQMDNESRKDRLLKKSRFSKQLDDSPSTPIICYELSDRILELIGELSENNRDENIEVTLRETAQEFDKRGCPVSPIKGADRRFISNEIEFFISLPEQAKKECVEETIPFIEYPAFDKITRGTGAAQNVYVAGQVAYAGGKAAYKAGQQVTAGAGARRNAMHNVHGAFGGGHHSAGPYGSLHEKISKFDESLLDY